MDIWESIEKYTSIYTNKISSEEKLPEHIKYVTFYSNSWTFKGGQIFNRSCGRLNMIGLVYRIENLAVNESLFNKKDLLNTCLEIIKYDSCQIHNERSNDNTIVILPQKWPNELGPLNAQWLKINNINWLYYEYLSLIDSSTHIQLCTPLSDEHIIQINFPITLTLHNAGNAFQGFTQIPLDNFRKYILDIIYSLKLDIHNQLSSGSGLKSDDKGEKPVIEATPDHILLAKTVMRAWSAKEYTNPKLKKDDDHRASYEDVSALIDKLVQPTPLPNSYPRGEVMHNYMAMQILKDEEERAKAKMQEALSKSQASLE